MSVETPKTVDVLIMFATYDELAGMERVLEKMFCIKSQELINRDNRLTYLVACIPIDGKPNLKIAMMMLPDHGSIAMGNCIGHGCSFLNPKTLALCGLCYGISDEVKIGDIVIANNVVEFCFPQSVRSIKCRDDVHVKEDFDWRPPTTIKMPESIIVIADRLLTIFMEREGIDFTDQSLAKAFPFSVRKIVLKYLWEKRYLELDDLKLTPEGRKHVQEISEHIQDVQPKVHVGTIVATYTPYNLDTIKNIKDIIPDALVTDRVSCGFEMGASIGRIDSIVVKCVSRTWSCPEDPDSKRCASEFAAYFLIKYLCCHLD